MMKRPKLDAAGRALTDPVHASCPECNWHSSWCERDDRSACTAALHALDHHLVHAHNRKPFK